MQHTVVLTGSGCSMSAGGPSMARLWSAAVEDNWDAESVADSVRYDLSDKNIEKFLSKVEAFLQFSDDVDAKKFLLDSKSLILKECTDFLNDDKLRAHETFLHRFSTRRTRDPRLKIFTTNYDLCFERAAINLGLVVMDGFSFSKPRQYDPLYFGYDIVRRSNENEHGSFLEGVFILYKLHGSVNWARRNGEIVEADQPEPQEACLIYPAAGKYQQAFLQPHLEAISQYLAALRRPNTCMIVAGFGFNDDHLSEPLLAAARSNPHLRLIIADYEAESKSQDYPNHYWKALFDLGDKGGDVWFINGSFQEFSDLIPNLKALSPAERLRKALLDATSENSP